MGGIVGALAALVSNFFLMQGPWTPFQMLAWGAAGLASGVLGKWWKDPPAVLLAVYGAAWGYLFGWAMNLWFWLTMVYPHTFSSWVAANASSFLFDTAHAVGNFLFCWLAGPMMLKVLRRFQKRFAVRIVEHEESEMTEVKSK